LRALRRRCGNVFRAAAQEPLGKVSWRSNRFRRAGNTKPIVALILLRYTCNPGRDQVDNGTEVTSRVVHQWAYQNKVALHFIEPAFR